MWPEVEESSPKRFLGDRDGADILSPTKSGAWRPFGHGPRLRISIELALKGLKVILALTILDFDLKEAFDEWDRVNKPEGMKAVNGGRDYETQNGSAYAADGFSCANLSTER